MKMTVIDTEIEGVLIIEPKVFSDERGYFFESFSQKDFEEKILIMTFVHDSELLQFNVTGKQSIW